MKRMAVLMIALMAGSLLADSSAVRFRGIAEFGMLSVVSHRIQFGKNGTDFDYVSDGGQDVLFQVARYSVEMDVGRRNTFILLYQPLALETTGLLKSPVIFDSLTFPASPSGINCFYGFPFYRASWLRELLPDNARNRLAVGLTLQIRNATISFESTDGALFRTNRDVGLVPAFKVRGRTNLTDRFFLGMEADGIYAPVSYLNGSDNEVVGAILDASVRAGWRVRDPGTVFVNLRYLGGGATGTSTREVWPGDGYVKNWLHFMFFTAGYIHQF